MIYTTTVKAVLEVAAAAGVGTAEIPAGAADDLAFALLVGGAEYAGRGRDGIDRWVVRFADANWAGRELRKRLGR